MAKKSKRRSTHAVRAPDPDQQNGSLRHIGGSPFDAFNNVLANQAFNALWLNAIDDGERQNRYQAVLGTLIGIAPRNEIEGMLATQLIACHSASMECLRRAMICEQSLEARNADLGQANKLSRTFANLLEALNRHRGKEQQKVVVEHVHVHQGGQAIVGSVQHGGGSNNKDEEQPHAQPIANAPQPKMRCEDPQRKPVPRAGDGKR